MNETRRYLDLIEVASPCEASWDEMTGDERMRFCGQCKLHVYNISEMEREEAERFIRSREGRTCVRFYRRQDGTVLTKDCPVGLRALRQRFARGVAALVGLLVALIGGTLFGNVINRRLPSGFQRPGDALANWIYPERRWTMGTAPPMGVMGKLVPVSVVMGGCPAPPPGGSGSTGITISNEPAETPLPQPTQEQVEEIQRRLEK
jgi:hypothetical protein